MQPVGCKRLMFTKNYYLCDLKGSKTGYDLLLAAGEMLICLGFGIG